MVPTFGVWNKYAIMYTPPSVTPARPDRADTRYFGLLFFPLADLHASVYIGRKYTEKEYPIFESLANTGNQRGPTRRVRTSCLKFDEFSPIRCARVDSEKGGGWIYQVGLMGGNGRKEYVDGKRDSKVSYFNDFFLFSFSFFLYFEYSFD